jgi:hypothetical protein
MNKKDKRYLIDCANEEKTFLTEIMDRIRLHDKTFDERVKKLLLKKRGN